MSTSRFLRFANSSWRMWFFMLWKLPAARFMGVRVQYCDLDRCVVELPYRWRSQNPFRSIYFAAQCAAGEFSTGLLALAHLQEKPPVSMLVSNIEADFSKKASETLRFTCSDGQAIAAVIKKALETGEAQTFQALSIGLLPDGQEAARVRLTWSFKAKK